MVLNKPKLNPNNLIGFKHWIMENNLRTRSGMANRQLSMFAAICYFGFPKSTPVVVACPVRLFFEFIIATRTTYAEVTLLCAKVIQYLYGLNDERNVRRLFPIGKKVRFFSHTKLCHWFSLNRFVVKYLSVIQCRRGNAIFLCDSGLGVRSNM